jgi:precorrin-4/cobalt-precorrin-4 C11-methyltransferase
MARGADVARVHSGDPCLYGAVAEQMRRLDALAIPYDVTPGVPAFAAAAAALRQELTIPEVAQTIILTRTAMKASDMPPGERLEELGRSRATLAIHLSIRNLGAIERALTPHYGPDCPVAVVYRASWPDELVIRATLATVAKQVRAAKLTRTALILVGPALGSRGFRDSALYDPAHQHVLRHRKMAASSRISAISASTVNGGRASTSFHLAAIRTPGGSIARAITVISLRAGKRRQLLAPDGHQRRSPPRQRRHRAGGIRHLRQRSPGPGLQAGRSSLR